MFNKLGKLVFGKSKETRIPYNAEMINKLAAFEVQSELFKITFNFDYSDLTTGQKVLHNLFILDGEVNNGGYIQYFQNNKDEFLKGTLDALKAIAYKKQFNFFKEAIEIYYRNEAFLSAKNLHASFDTKDEKRLAEFDQFFYDSAKERDALITKYLQKNILDFFRDDK